MPVYTYRREDGTTFDIRQRFFDSPFESCPATGQAVSRVIQPAGIIFKGSGFYVNDNNKAKNPAKPTAADGNGNDNGKTAGDTEKSESKKETKSENKSASSEAAPAAN